MKRIAIIIVVLLLLVVYLPQLSQAQDDVLYEIYSELLGSVGREWWDLKTSSSPPTFLLAGMEYRSNASRRFLRFFIRGGYIEIRQRFIEMCDSRSSIKILAWVKIRHNYRTIIEGRWSEVRGKMQKDPELEQILNEFLAEIRAYGTRLRKARQEFSNHGRRR